MFYSHEILTSPEHGVATVWLVATLGSRSISRRLNRKTILDVDVPKACGVIMDPVAPMALRLQSNLLYGVSRVYSQQCGYTLLDVQAMHDKMRAMLRSIPAGGLDPAAGKARPEQLVLPYDPSFLPENNLPGLGLDLSKLKRMLEADASQQSEKFWPHTPDLTQSALSGSSSLQLNLPSEDNILRNMGGFSSEADVPGSAQRGFGIGGLMTSALNEDAGVLLQPDFEFDEDGNIIELGSKDQSGVRSDRRIGEETEANENEAIDFAFEDQPMLVDDDIEMATGRRRAEPPARAPTPGRNDSPIVEQDGAENRHSVTMPQRQRAPRVLPSDGQTALRNSELAHMNDDYINNMAVASRHKQQNKIPTQAKRNAVYWVFGMGIGGVGAGLGPFPVMHPLHSFCGDELREVLSHGVQRRGRKRALENDDSESDERRVRAREEDDDHMVRADLVDDNNFWNQDVEIGRHASPTLHEDNSSQMPWNITASVQSSRHDASAANIFRGFGSVSDFSSRGKPDSVSSFGTGLAGIGRSRSRLTSASPLAGRGFPYDINSLDNILVPDHGEDDLEGFDLGEYLEADAMVETNSNAEAGVGTYGSRPELQNSLSESVMDQESLNFLHFLTAKIDSLKSAESAGGDVPSTPPPADASGDSVITFSTLLPPQKTSRAVATHGLMHILALATKGFLAVRQDAYQDQSSEEHGVQYEYGEIFLRLAT